MRACVRGGPTFSDLIWALNEFVACVRCVRLLRAIVASDDRAFPLPPAKLRNLEKRRARARARARATSSIFFS